MSIKKTTYKGYSTVGGNRRNYLYDVDLIKQDLINIIKTRKTERLRNAEFGCKLLDMLFELKTEVNIQEIVTEVLYIISTEPRVKLLDIAVNTDIEYQIQVDCVLLYIGEDIKFDFNLSLNTQTGTITETSGDNS